MMQMHLPNPAPPALKEAAMKKGRRGIRLILCLCLALVCFGGLTGAFSSAQASELAYYTQGAATYVPGSTADYDWWYGCSPTSAGMMMGYYDLNGYGGLYYPNLVPGVAETSTFPSTAGTWNYNAQYAIASPEHVNDFYINGYLGSGDDNIGPPILLTLWPILWAPARTLSVM